MYSIAQEVISAIGSSVPAADCLTGSNFPGPAVAFSGGVRNLVGDESVDASRLIWRLEATRPTVLRS